MNVNEAVNIEDLRQLAARWVPRGIFDFVEGGVEDEIGLANNQQVFRRCRLVPRYLVDTSHHTQTTTLFGRQFSAPFGIAPMGLCGLFRPGADIFLASAARGAGIPYVMSNMSSASIEEGVIAGGDCTFFQLYAAKDPSITLTNLKRVADLGVQTLMYAVDTPVVAKRERLLRSGFEMGKRPTLPYLLEALRHPGWIYEYFRSGGMPKLKNWLLPEETARTSMLEILQRFSKEFAYRSQTWKDLELVRRHWPGNLLVKGILHPGDAMRSVEMGADGIVVSNHGGRQLDLAPSPLEMLPLVRASVSPGIPVMLDSGIRRGSDIVCAISLGASFVFVGRAALYGAIAGKQRGAARAIDILRNEIDQQMGQLGCASIEDLGPHLFMDRVLQFVADSR